MRIDAAGEAALHGCVAGRGVRFVLPHRGSRPRRRREVATRRRKGQEGEEAGYPSAHRSECTDFSAVRVETFQKLEREGAHMQLAKDSCACGHPLDQHDGGRGGPCNYCGCAAGAPPPPFEVGVIHSLHELTTMLSLVVKEIPASSGAPSDLVRH